MARLSVDVLLAEARSRTGLDDFGPSDFLPGFELLITDLNQHGQIGDDRRGALHERFMRLLTNRLWFAKDLREHPEIADERIESPILIGSMPRTGSTKLHRLLAASGDFQYTPMWKTHMFARIPGLAAGGEAERIAQVREYEAWMIAASPDIRSGHPMFTDEAEEDQWLLECTFRRAMLAIMFSVPNYAQWLAQQDPSCAYEYLHSQLQYLQWQNRKLRGDAEATKPWLLKSPDHFGFEMFLHARFDSMRFVLPHRDPVECMASSTAMVKPFRRLYSDQAGAENLAGNLVQMFSQIANAHLNWRSTDLTAQVLDVSFRQITHDGLGAAAKIYDFAGLTLTSPAVQSMQRWEIANEQHKHGRNIYSMDDIGPSPEEVRKAFDGYIARYADFL